MTPDIPEDIRAIAWGIADQFTFDHGDSEWEHAELRNTISKAIFSERTRATEAAQVRYAPAIGTTLSEMRASIPAELYNLGDVKLVWANEGDLAIAASIRTEGTKP